MVLSFTAKKRMRKEFGAIKSVAEIPNLIEVQKKSYESFLQYNVKPEERQPIGLEAVFRSQFPITDSDGKATFDYVSYRLEPPKYDIVECLHRGVNYSAPLRATLR